MTPGVRITTNHNSNNEIPNTNNSSDNYPSNTGNEPHHQQQSPPHQQRTNRKKSYRTGPYPYSILDKKILLEKLEENGLLSDNRIKPIHIDTFYQILHRQHYPMTLPEFVANYYLEEENHHYKNHRIVNNNKLNHSNNDNQLNLITNQNIHEDENNNNENENNNNIFSNSRNYPIQNSKSQKKNTNKIQLPKPFLQFLNTTNDFVVVTSQVVQVKHSVNRSTTKLIIQLHDTQYIEAVIMRYVQKNNNNNISKDNKRRSGRASLCVSSQCGCAMGCTVRNTENAHFLVLMLFLLLYCIGILFSSMKFYFY